MATETEQLPDIEIDYSKLVTEDEEPLDSVFQERQQKLFTDSLYASWKSPNHPWWAASNVGVFYREGAPAIVPDMFLAIGVSGPPDITVKKGHSYYIWREGQPPDLVAEMVSEKTGRESTRKLQIYSQMRVGWYVLFDPACRLSDEPLKVFVRNELKLVPTKDRLFPSINLGVTIARGEFDGFTADYLRWTDGTGAILPAKMELVAEVTQRAAEAMKRADNEAERADDEAERADLERKRAEQVTRQRDEARLKADHAESELARMADLLRKAGIDPTSAN